MKQKKILKRLYLGKVTISHLDGKRLDGARAGSDYCNNEPVVTNDLTCACM